MIEWGPLQLVLARRAGSSPRGEKRFYGAVKPVRHLTASICLRVPTGACGGNNMQIPGRTACPSLRMVALYPSPPPYRQDARTCSIPRGATAVSPSFPVVAHRVCADDTHACAAREDPPMHPRQTQRRSRAMRQESAPPTFATDGRSACRVAGSVRRTLSCRSDPRRPHSTVHHSCARAPAKIKRGGRRHRCGRRMGRSHITCC